eukprot:m.156463 g.156463  ORF g.156463 m.156463 type:complete len:888 (+) comp16989_c0_seq1:150-2813(+)
MSSERKPPRAAQPRAASFATDVQDFGCLIAGMFLLPQLGGACQRKAVGAVFGEQQANMAVLLGERLQELPSCVRYGVKAMLDPDETMRPSCAKIATVSPAEPLLAFPPYFEALYQFNVDMRNTIPARRADVIRKWQGELFAFTVEGFDLVLPSLLQTMLQPECQLELVDLFDAVASRLGRTRTRDTLVKPITKLYESNDEQVLMKIHDLRFVRQLFERLDRAVVTDCFLPLLLKGLLHRLESVRQVSVLTHEWLSRRLSIAETVTNLLRPLLSQAVPPQNAVGEAVGKIMTVHGEGMVIMVLIPLIREKISRAGSGTPYALLNGISSLCQCIANGTWKEESVISDLGFICNVTDAGLKLVANANSSMQKEILSALCYQTIDLYSILSRRIGRKRATNIVSDFALKFFHMIVMTERLTRDQVAEGSAEAELGPFNTTYTPRETSIPLLLDVLDAQLAVNAYCKICKLVGQETLRLCLGEKQTALIENIVYSDRGAYREAWEKASSESKLEMFVGGGSEEPHSSVDSFTLVYDRLELDNVSSTDSLLSGTLSTLSGRKASMARLESMEKNWKMYWEAQTSGRRTEFSNLCLNTLKAHSAAIRICTYLPNESLLITGSKDKTVKIWSTSTTVTPVTGVYFSQLRSREHVRSPYDAVYASDCRRMASTDGNVDVWDPETGELCHRYNMVRAPAQRLATVSTRRLVAAAAGESLQLLDLRSPRMFEWKTVNSQPAVVISAICVDTEGEWIAVGFATGRLALFSARMGVFVWRAQGHEAEVTQVRQLCATVIASTALDTQVLLFKTKDGSLITRLPAYPDPLKSLHIYNDTIYALFGSRVAISQVTHQMDFTVSPMRSERLSLQRTTATCMDVNVDSQYVYIGDEAGIVRTYA